MTNTPQESPSRPESEVIQTACGRSLTLGRIRLTGLQHATARVTLDLHREPYDSDELWLSLTPAEARHLAAGLLSRAAAAEREATDAGGDAQNKIEVGHVSGESYGIRVRGHEVLVDQPAALGGADSAMTPTELLVASLASCVAFYAGRYLSRHGISRDGLRVTAEYDMASDRPARVSAIRLLLVVTPELPAARRPGLLAVASACTVHNTLHRAPEVSIDLNDGSP